MKKGLLPLLESNRAILTHMFEWALAAPPEVLPLADVSLNSIVRDSAAGAVVLRLREFLRRTWVELGADGVDWIRPEPHYNGRSLGEVLQAAANNSRHWAEWAS